MIKCNYCKLTKIANQQVEGAQKCITCHDHKTSTTTATTSKKTRKRLLSQSAHYRPTTKNHASTMMAVVPGTGRSCHCQPEPTTARITSHRKIHCY